MNREPLLLRALRHESIPRFPVWMMRQAGRYLPEYRRMKERFSFSEMCLIPEVSVEVALQPLREFGFDAAILFSDIMIPAQALGFEIEFAPGPIVKNALERPEQISALPAEPNLEELRAVFEAISLLRAELKDEALIGFAATPFTLACYLISQKPFKHFERSLIWAREDATAFHSLLEKLTSLTESYIGEQVKAGAQVIQLFDSWGGIIPPELYEEYSLQYSNRIFHALRSAQVPSILYLNGAAPYISQLSERLRADGLSVDSRVDLPLLDEMLPRLSLQGNLDSSALFAANVPELTEKMLRKLKRKTGYIANLGHGVLQETPVSGVREFVERVKSFNLT